MKIKEMVVKARNLLADPVTGLVFGLLVLLYKVIYTIVPVRAFIQNSGLSFISSAQAVIGFVLLLLVLFVKPDRLLRKEMIIPWILLLALFLSTITNVGKNLEGNIRTIVWQADLMLLIYSSYIYLGEVSSENVNKIQEHKIAYPILKYGTYILLTILNVAFLVSLFYFFRLYYGEVITEMDFSYQGLYEGRLYGVFTTPYHVALISSLSAITFLFFILNSSGIKKAIFVISFIMAASVAVLSDTRAVWLGVYVASTIVIAMILLEKSYWNKNIQRKILAVILALLFTVGLYMFRTVYHRSLNNLALIANKTDMVASTAGSDLNNSEANLNRPDANGNISSNRIWIWQDYIHVLLDRPDKLIFGYSPREYMEYINTNYEDLYIVQYYRYKYSFYYIRQHDVYAAHNSILTVLISTGIAGLLPLILLAYKTLKQAFEHYHSGNFKTSDYCVFFALITIVTGMMFESDVFYQVNTTSVIFWMLLGYFHGHMHTDKKDDKALI